MSLQFIIGSSGAGKSYFAYERVIRESMEHPERNYYIIAVTSIFLVAIFASLLYIILAMVFPGTAYPWLCYAYAVPTATIVWLVFNSVWFNPHRNFVIVSVMVWSLLAALYLTFAMQGFKIWPILLLGIPVQIIIWMWSNLRKKSEKGEKERIA